LFFPFISTYTAFVGVNSITNIVNDTIALTQEANVISFSTEITGDVWGGNFSVTGNETVGGTLGVTGVTTLTGSLNANGGITGDNFVVADTTGNTSIGGTLGVTNTTTLTGNVGIGGASGTETLLVTG
jgi:hypothetical protein